MRMHFSGICVTGKTTLVEFLYSELGLITVYNNMRIMSELEITNLSDV